MACRRPATKVHLAHCLAASHLPAERQPSSQPRARVAAVSSSCDAIWLPLPPSPWRGGPPSSCQRPDASRSSQPAVPHPVPRQSPSTYRRARAAASPLPSDARRRVTAPRAARGPFGRSSGSHHSETSPPSTTHRSSRPQYRKSSARSVNETSTLEPAGSSTRRKALSCCASGTTRRKSAAAKRRTVWLRANEEGFETVTDALTAPVRGRAPEERRRGPYCSRE
mmetsp:Transcript_8838/g.29327  ORF Transcript_8838/g.29327 Transcript_8838/m.29327 type:complete len:224 (-) Transcript_8838:798-1469(-)